MITIIQRVLWAKVEIKGQLVGHIERGILALLAIEKNDTPESVQRLTERVLNYRIFPDQSGRMNLSLIDIQGELLMVPQFTLAADTEKGNRPSFGPAANPEQGSELFDMAVAFARSKLESVQQGQFGTDMQVSLLNDGPVTFQLRSKP